MVVSNQTNWAAHSQNATRPREAGRGIAELLQAVCAGGKATRIAAASHQGLGSRPCATRVAPLGAYFSNNIEQLVHEAQASAMPTHTHCEAIAGAVAVAGDSSCH